MTIDCQGHEIKAHKIILSQASKYFRLVLETEPHGRPQSTMTLVGDDPQHIRSMVAWLYGLHFDGAMNLLRVKPASTVGLMGFNYVRYSIDLYVTAGKYLVLSLQHAIAADLRGNLNVLCRTAWFFPYIDMVAKQVYLAHTEAARPLRTHVVGVLGDIFEKLDGAEDVQRFKKLMKDIPELSWDLLVKAGRDIADWRSVASQEW